MKKVIKVEVKEPQYMVNTNVTFGQAAGWCGHLVQDLKMDIVFAEHTERRPCIVWICGGAWLQMSRCAHLAYLCELAKKGFVVASVQYRTSNEVQFPGPLMDVKAAIRYLKANSERFGIDTEHFGVMGESAGGHLTAMTALTGKRKEFDQGQYLEYSSEVQAACPWYPPTDLRGMPGTDEIRKASSPESLLVGKNVQTYPEDALEASPVHYVTPDAPPFLLIHGTADSVVPFEQSEMLYEVLEKNGVSADLVGLEGSDHADLPFFQKEVWDMIADFFHEKLG